MRQALVVANWKMNGTSLANADLLQGILAQLPASPQAGLVVCPPSIYLAQVAATLANSPVAWGGQNCAESASGAFTGEISASMLSDLGCRYTIVGHSERRTLYQESNETAALKFIQAIEAELRPILCIGETEQERAQGMTESVIAQQLAAVISPAGIGVFQDAIIAYEPVWAIGTGKSATAQEAQNVHAFIRGQINRHDAKIAGTIPLLYGGSVKPTNAQELFSQPDIDGGLIGGASLKADDFSQIISGLETVLCSKYY